MGRTIRGLHHVRVPGIFYLGLDEFGQMAVPSACHLQQEQERINQGTQNEKYILLNSMSQSHHDHATCCLLYLGVQRTSDGHLPLFGKHASHEKVGPAEDYAVQTIFLRGNIYLQTKQKNEKN